ncbi:MAG: IS701 family transposase [Bryobacteraceae bacterium]
MGHNSAPNPQEKRFAAYTDGLAKAAGHADRTVPLKSYCAGLLLPGERKSVEPMVARLAPDNVQRTHQSLHHLVAASPWSDEAVLESVREHVLTAMERNGPVAAWIVDDTGFLKKGTHSAGVARQYCGQVGKQDNCRVAVSLSVATHHASLPIAWRLYLPESWATDPERRTATGVPEAIGFQTKPAIALSQIRQAVEQGVSPAPVLADAGYGHETRFREEITALGLPYAVGVQGTTTVWPPGETPRPKKRRRGRGRPPTQLPQEAERQPVTVKELALALPGQAWKTVAWRAGTKRKLSSRFAAVRVRPAHRDGNRTEPYPEEWLLMEWPPEETEPAKYWLSTLPAHTKLTALVRIVKHRWIIKRDYEELKRELGLGHYEGRGWRGFHHHATLCIAAYGFLVIERTRFSPSAHAGPLDLRAAKLPPRFQPRGSPNTRRTA